MSTCVVYLKVFLQSCRYLNNTIMTFILQSDKAMLGSSVGQQSKAQHHSMFCMQICVYHFGWAMWVVNWKVLLGHREMKSRRQLLPASQTNRVANARQGASGPTEKIISLFPCSTNPLALGILGLPTAIWHWGVLSRFPSCNALSYCSSRISFSCCWHQRNRYHSLAGKHLQKSCSRLAKFALFL